MVTPRHKAARKSFRLPQWTCLWSFFGPFPQENRCLTWGNDLKQSAAVLYLNKTIRVAILESIWSGTRGHYWNAIFWHTCWLMTFIRTLPHTKMLSSIFKTLPAKVPRFGRCPTWCKMIRILIAPIKNPIRNLPHFGVKQTEVGYLSVPLRYVIHQDYESDKTHFGPAVPRYCTGNSKQIQSGMHKRPSI